MKEIKFTTKYESPLYFSDENFKTKYLERIGETPGYIQTDGDGKKYYALCPRCNNPVVILGIFKKIDVAPHARHARDITIPGITQFNEHKFLNCPYHRKKTDYVKDRVPESEEPQRQELFRIAKEHYDKAIYLLQKETGIKINLKMVEDLAENYVLSRAYNYIDATIYNIPWYLIYSFDGFELYHMMVKKHTTLYDHLLKIGLKLKESKVKGHVYVENKEGYLLRATNYRYVVDKDDNINEWLEFSILRPDANITDTILYVAADRFSIKVDSYYFSNLIEYQKWIPNQKVLDIAEKYMNP